MKYLSILLASYLLVGCSEKDVAPKVIEKPKVKSVKVEKQKLEQPKLNKTKKLSVPKDLLEISQDVKVYTDGINYSYISTQKKFEKDYFRVWNIEKISVPLSVAKWAYGIYTPSNSYGENLKKHNAKFFKDIDKESNFKEYATINKRAISLDNLDIRTYPTDKPVFLDPKRAGEGFPFDYMQNSTIAPNKPLFISHYSKSGEWVFVESSFAFGWVKSKDIALIDKKYTDIWKKAKQVYITSDDKDIYADDGSFLFKSRVGMMLPLVSEDDKSYKVLTISSEHSRSIYNISKVSKEYTHLGILSMNEKNIDKIIKGMKYTKYGWGGLFDQRDCSSTLRDFYAPFGVWLPRNSHKQSITGKVISLDGLSDDEKLELIKSKAIPFRTLLYRKGHIVLYVGVRDDKVIVFQNMWGIKTKDGDKEGRYIVGKAVFSTLNIGEDLTNFDADKSLLSQLKSMTKL